MVKNEKGEVEFDKDGQVKLMFADIDVRLAQEPFPLWPGEVLKKPPTELKVIGGESWLTTWSGSENTSLKQLPVDFGLPC